MPEWFTNQRIVVSMYRQVVFLYKWVFKTGFTIQHYIRVCRMGWGTDHFQNEMIEFESFCAEYMHKYVFQPIQWIETRKSVSNLNWVISSIPY